MTNNTDCSGPCRKLTTIELYKEDMKFSSGHFTLLSETERERLHGHNYQVRAQITAILDQNGLTFDYRFYKNKIRQLCRQLNEYFLLPSQSPYLSIEQKKPYYLCHFNGEAIPFLPCDVKLLPIANITVEALSQWFIDQLLLDEATLMAHQIQTLQIHVSSGPGQSGSSTWRLGE